MDKQITNVVFTRNRPLQLDGYLRSLYRHFPQNLFQTYILYKRELFGEQYEQLFQKFPDCKVIEETNFSSDFLSILNKAGTNYILFGVDDVVYFDSVDFDVLDETFKQFSGEIFGFSLRLNLQNVTEGGETFNEFNIGGESVYRIDWTKGKIPNTRYPFELCATIYKTELVKKIIRDSRKNNSLCENLFAPNSTAVRVFSKIIRRHKLLKMFGYFYNPNTLESWNCRWCQGHRGQLPGYLYFQKLCASAIQVNMVNTSTLNTFDGSNDHTVEALNEKYKQAYKFDIDFLANNKPPHPHSGQEYFHLINKM